MSTLKFVSSLPKLTRYSSFRRPFSSLPFSSSSNPSRNKKSLTSIRALYEASKPITVLTAYDYPTALHVDRAGADIALVGDSLGMVCLGYPTTQAVTLDQMIHHAQAARRGTHSALLVADMPFGTYETSPEKAVETAVRLVKEAGVDAVKLEGGRSRAKIVNAIVDSGIAVMGHVGLLPQAVGRVGGFRATGRTAYEAKNIILDAHSLQSAGAFSIVVECVPSQVAQLITSSISIPTIGIGSGVSCDGQVLVYHDLLRILSHPGHHNVAPKFSKSYAELGLFIDESLRKYCEEVRSREFPSPQYSPYTIPSDQLEQLQEFVQSQDKKDVSSDEVNEVVKSTEEDGIKIY